MLEAAKQLDVWLPETRWAQEQQPRISADERGLQGRRSLAEAFRVVFWGGESVSLLGHNQRPGNWEVRDNPQSSQKWLLTVLIAFKKCIYHFNNLLVPWCHIIII